MRGSEYPFPHMHEDVFGKHLLRSLVLPLRFSIRLALEVVSFANPSTMG